MIDKVCPYCDHPLMEIDHYGVVGCITCNHWGDPGDDKLIMELMDGGAQTKRRRRRLKVPSSNSGSRIE